MAVSREETYALRERKGISSRVADFYLQKTLTELHAQGGTPEDAKKYLVMPMAERRAVVDEQGGDNLAFAYSFVSPVPAAALTAHEFGADFWPLWDEVGEAIPNMNLFPAPEPCPPVEPVSTQELFHVSCDDLAYYWRPDGRRMKQMAKISENVLTFKIIASLLKAPASPRNWKRKNETAKS